MQRAAVYIDGFNLYYGMHEKFGRKFLWLDPWALGEAFLNDGQELTRAAYFTARVRNDPPAQQRQGQYLRALKEASPCDVIEGRFQEKTKTCRKCGASWRHYEEKETDVSLASALIEDAAQGLYDRAVLVTGDSDLGPAVQAARRLNSNARFIAAFPPGRTSEDLKKQMDGFFNVGRDKLLASQLPDPVVEKGTGRLLPRPLHWS